MTPEQRAETIWDDANMMPKAEAVNLAVQQAVEEAGRFSNRGLFSPKEYDEAKRKAKAEAYEEGRKAGRAEGLEDAAKIAETCQYAACDGKKHHPKCGWEHIALRIRARKDSGEGK